MIAEKVQRLEKNYKYSARRYGYLSNLVTIPSIVITSSSSIFSFLSTTDMIDPEIKNYCIIAVAILTSIATMFQTISSSCEYNVKKTKFTEATQQFNHLSDRIFFEIENSNEKDFIDKMEKEIEAIKNQCKFIPLESKERVNKSDYTPLN